MNLNYFAFFLIAFIPLIIGSYWYHPRSIMSKYSKLEFIKLSELSFSRLFLLFLMSVAIVYGYINLVIHQMGFYELFFTDIMFGNEASEKLVKTFLDKYGDKHRHFGHGVFHGLINACIIALPFIGALTILEKKDKSYFIHHFSYWLITSALIGGCISEYV